MYNVNGHEYSYGDGVRGVVTHCNNKGGVYFVLDNGDEAFAWYGALPVNTVVLGKFLKGPKGDKLMQVDIESTTIDMYAVA